MVATALSKQRSIALATELLQLPAQDATEFGVKPAEVRQTLVDAIKTFSRDDAHTERARRVLLDENRFRPVWSTIREAFQRTAVVPEKAYCDLCSGSGYIVQYWLTRLIRGKTHRVELLPDCMTDAQAYAIVRTLPVGQDVKPLASRCACNPALEAA